MKNLKRILSVVLVVAMAFSLVTVAGAAADDYTDAAQIEHKAAVDTLSALGVLKGRDDGSFGAKDILSRAEMSTMVTRVMLGKTITDGQFDERVLSLYASTVKFSDMDKGAWYLGYVGYVAANKVVTGDTEDGRGTFRPDDKVTYAEAAKMILVALGYDPTYSGLTGLNWVANTLAIAQPLGILDEIDLYDVNAQLNRDDMSQMLYNMLEVEVMEYSPLYGYSRTNKTAIEYYFNQESQVVVEGVVVANGYTNLGINGTETSRSVDPTDQRDSTYAIDTVAYPKYNAANIGKLSAVAKEFLNTTGSGASTSYVPSINYNPKTQTVVYLPEAECYGQGTCSVKHNVNNTNCPKNNTDIFVKITAASGEAEIGRTVNVAFVGGSWIENYSYAYITPTDDNVVETVAPYVGRNANPTINSLTNDVKVAKGTVVAEIWTDTDAAAAVGKFNVAAPVAQGITNAKAIQTAIDGVKTNSKEVVTLIDNDKDGEAEYVIKVRKDLAVAAEEPNADTTVSAAVSRDDGDNTERTYTLPAGTEMEAKAKLLAYTALNGEVIYDVRDVHVGKITHVSNQSGMIYIDDADEHNFVSGLDSAIDLTDQSIKTSVKTELVGYGVTYYLDDAGNIVWIKVTDDASVEALIYGVESTDTGTVTGMTSTTAAKIYTINVDGEKAEYNIPKTVVANNNTTTALPGGIITITGTGDTAKVESDFSKALYCKITLADDTVKKIDILSTPAPNYLLGSLATGTVASSETTMADKAKETNAVTSAQAYVGDSTVVFNFVQKTTTGAPVTNTTPVNQFALGDVEIGHGAAGVKDVETEGKLNVTAYESGDDDIADVMVTTLKRDGSLVNITNATTTAKTDYVVISRKNVEDAKSNEVKQPDGMSKWTWTVPCVGDSATITLGSEDNSNKNIEVKSVADADTRVKLLDTMTSMSTDYLVLKVIGTDEDTVVGATIDDVQIVNLTSVAELSVVSTDTSRIATDDGTTVMTYGYADDSIVLLWDGVSFETVTFADALAKVDDVNYTAANVSIAVSEKADTFAKTVDVAIVTLQP